MKDQDIGQQRTSHL